MENRKMNILLFFVAVGGVVQCATEQEIKAELFKKMFSCAQELKVDPRHLQSLKENVLPDDKPTKCMLACTYRKFGTMDDKGMYLKQKLYDLAEKMFANDPTKMEKFKEIGETCDKVNNAPVSDGEQGCERAALMFSCLSEESSKAKMQF